MIRCEVLAVKRFGEQIRSVNTDMRTLGAFALELGAFLSLCLMLAILMGVPALWSTVGAVILMDLGVILFLTKGRSGPDDPNFERLPRFRHMITD